eukprot:11133-Heterococcus_DN1.PRE.1
MNVIVQELLSRPEWRDGTKDQLYSTIFMAKRHQLEYKERPDELILVLVVLTVSMNRGCIMAEGKTFKSFEE